MAHRTRVRLSRSRYLREFYRVTESFPTDAPIPLSPRATATTTPCTEYRHAQASLVSPVWRVLLPPVRAAGQRLFQTMPSTPHCDETLNFTVCPRKARQDDCSAPRWQMRKNRCRYIYIYIVIYACRIGACGHRAAVTFLLGIMNERRSSSVHYVYLVTTTTLHQFTFLDIFYTHGANRYLLVY